MPVGVGVALTSCTDPARHDEYNRWYSHTHLPDLSKTKGFVRARRFVNRNPEGDSPHYLALYDFDAPDLKAAVWEMMQIGQQTMANGRHIDCMEVVAVHSWLEVLPSEYRPLEKVSYPVPQTPPQAAAPQLPAPKRLPVKTLPRGLFMLFTVCTDPARDEEYNRWLSHIHLPDMKACRYVTSARRYRNIRPERGPSPYMTVYEFEAADLDAAMADFQRVGAEVRDRGRRIDCSKPLQTYFFQEIDAAAYPPLTRLDYPRQQPARRA